MNATAPSRASAQDSPAVLSNGRFGRYDTVCFMVSSVVVGRSIMPTTIGVMDTSKGLQSEQTLSVSVCHAVTATALHDILRCRLAILCAGH